MTLHHIALFASSEQIATHGEKTLGDMPYIHPSALIYESYIGSYCDIGPNSSLVETTFGEYSYAAADADIIYTTVGRFCSIASHVRINPGNHPMERVTQHHMTYRRKQYGFAETDDAAFFDWRREHACNIGHDVWIGHAAIIMPGVTVGTGAVIGSGAVVTKDVEPYTIVGGVPARVIRRRFPQEVSAALLQIAWWDWNHETLKARFDDLHDVQTFIRKYAP